MKKFISLTLLITSIAFVSCRKETIPSPSPNTLHSINVEYRVYAESGHMNVEYTMSDNGVVSTPNVQIDRTNFSQSFTWTSGQVLSIKASNSIASGKEVRVDIYVDGVLFISGQANSPNAVAVASGVY